MKKTNPKLVKIDLKKIIDESDKPVMLLRKYTENIEIGEPLTIKLRYSKFKE